jgi:hypothetical protein
VVVVATGVPRASGALADCSSVPQPARARLAVMRVAMAWLRMVEAFLFA